MGLNSLGLFSLFKVGLFLLQITQVYLTMGSTALAMNSSAGIHHWKGTMADRTDFALPLRRYILVSGEKAKPSHSRKVELS